MDAQISGPSVRAAREGAKLSQAALAQALGINRMYYSLFEAGRYLLDADEQKSLQDFLDSHGIHLDADEPQAAATPDSVEDDAPAADSDDDAAPAGESDNRTDAARTTLDRIGTTVQATGLVSKRTAAAVAAAGAVLQTLDFTELLALAKGVNGTIEGLPASPAFTQLPLEEKLVWESRAAGMLICAALYGEAWRSSPCGDLARAAKSVRKDISDQDWDVRDLNNIGFGFFSDREKHRPLYQCELAPHIAKAAEQRRAPVLSQVDAH